jgi:ABC-type sugar transport system substrate-binding protein
MLIKSLVAAVAVVAGLVAAAGPAAAAEPETAPVYPVICVYQTLPDGTPLPVVCLPYPL